MQSSSSTRRKTAFVPWLAAMIIGATAHAGWILHELREPEPVRAAAPIHVEIDARPRVVEPSSRSLARERLRAQQPPARASMPSCRHASLAPQASEDEHDLDMWIEQTDRYTYTIDRRMLDRVALANFDGDALERLGVIARALGLAEPMELRNIRAGTPLFVLGLRTGDRLHAISTRGGQALERVEIALERRGRAIELVYRLI